MGKVSDRITVEEIIRRFSTDKTLTLNGLAKEIGVNQGLLYGWMRKEKLLYLLPVHRENPNNIIDKDMALVTREIREYEKPLVSETEGMTPGEKSESDDDIRMFRKNQNRVARRGPITPMGEAFSYLYHIKRFFLKFVADYDKYHEMIEELYEKNIRHGAELSPLELRRLEFLIEKTGDIPAVAGAIKKVTDSATNMWELVQESQAKTMIDPQVIMQILAKWLRGIAPDALIGIAADFRKIKAEIEGMGKTESEE